MVSGIVKVCEERPSSYALLFSRVFWFHLPFFLFPNVARSLSVFSSDTNRQEIIVGAKVEGCCNILPQKEREYLRDSAVAGL